MFKESERSSRTDLGQLVLDHILEYGPVGAAHIVTASQQSGGEHLKTK